MIQGYMAKDGSRPNLNDGAKPPHRLSSLIRAMALNAEWPSLEAVILEARAAGLSLPEVHDLVRAMDVTISSLPTAERDAMAGEIRAAKRKDAALLRDRLPPTPLTAFDREASLTVGSLLMDVGDFSGAATAFESSGHDSRAAEAWGAAGDIARMEVCLAREEGRSRQRREIRDFLARFEALLAGGQRLAALDLAASVPPDAPEARDLRASATDVEHRLCQGRTLALRGPDGTVTRFASLPARLGRDGFCQIILRDPEVSRQHARVLTDAAGFSVEDAGSRAGTCLCGARVSARVPLPAQGQLTLGEHCRLDFAIQGPDLLEMTGASGLDRGLHVFLSTGAIPLHAVFPALDGLQILPEERCARAMCTRPVRLAGQLVGQPFELLHGDVMEMGGLRLEVV